MNLATFFASLREMPSGCREWTRGKNSKGYGYLRFDGRDLRAIDWHLSWRTDQSQKACRFATDATTQHAATQSIFFLALLLTTSRTK